MPSVADRITALLDGAGVPYTHLAHAEARSAEEAAAVRGTALAIGGKSLLLKLEGLGFAVLAVGGDRRVDNRLLRRHLGISRYRFATPEELAAVTGLEPGAVPPFGRPIFEARLYVDAALAANDRIAFAAGSRSASILTSTADWLAAAKPDGIFDFSRS